MLRKIIGYLNKNFNKRKIQNCRLGDAVQLRAELICKGNNRVDSYTIIEAGRVVMNEFSTISSHCVLRGPISIGKFSQIGPHVVMVSKDHPFNSISICVNGDFLNGERKQLQIPEEIIIGNDVWIGAGVNILKGVKIGDGAVVAAGAVVNKDVPPYQIFGGVPANKISQRYPDEIINKLQSIAWWNWSIEKIRRHKTLFSKSEIDIRDLNLIEIN